MIAFSTQASTDLTQLSLEELMTIEITSVAKKSQRLSEAAAAIHVITHDEIRRSGMTSIPELLRMVPGLQVARIDASKWAISSRGSNGRWANKLLVLMDGRTLYTPLYSGVHWDTQDTAIEDIERIEVIRGSGGTLWGSNAVDGIINIITRHSRDTQDTLISSLAGNQEKSLIMRHGDSFGSDGWYRVYAKALAYENFRDATGSDSYDSWDQQRAGFRADWKTTSQDSLTLQGDVYQGDIKQISNILQDVTSTTQPRQDNSNINGANLLLRWQHSTDKQSDWNLQIYFDSAERDDLALKHRIDTFDIELQHRFPATDHQEIIWGLNYRYIEDDIENSFTVSFDPASLSQQIYSGFIQDEIQLNNELRFILGSKFEHNDFTGLEVLPNARVSWLMSNNRTLWSAISRAVRAPSRTDTDIRLNVSAFSSPFVDPDGPGPLAAGDPTLISILGNDNFKSEELLAFELGYREQFQTNLSIDITSFYNTYDKLGSSETSFSIETSPAPVHALIANTFENQMKGNSYGLELALNWQASQTWRIYTGYSWLKMDMQLSPTSTDTTGVRDQEDASPRQQFQLHSRWTVQPALELDLALYYVDSIELRDSATNYTLIPDYTRLDIRLGWQPRNHLELDLVAQNLLDKQHPEFLTQDVVANEIPRSFYARIKLQF